MILHFWSNALTLENVVEMHDFECSLFTRILILILIKSFQFTYCGNIPI